MGPKGNAPAPASSTAPEKYEAFKLPEGANAEALKPWESTFKELGLDQAKAQKLVDQYVTVEQSLVKAQVAALEKQNADWIGELKKGWGSEFDKHAGFAAKGIEGAGIPGLREWLHDAGLSNQPLLVQLFAKLGAEFFSEAQPGTGRADNGEAKTEPKSTGSLLYPQMSKDPTGRYGRGS